MIGRWVAYEIGCLKEQGMSSQEAADHIRKRIGEGYNYFRYGTDKSSEAIEYIDKYYPQGATR